MSKWLSNKSYDERAALRLICFPYAGGDVDIFRAWSKALSPAVEVCPVQLPGRGRRFFEDPFTNLTQLVQILTRELQPYLDKPFALFGHSMGAIMSFELARALRNERLAEPVHLFVSGWRAPHIPSRERPSYDLPQDEFLEKLRRLGGTPAELLENAKFVKLLLPLLRADFEVIQTYAYSPQPPLTCPITALGGSHDHVAGREELEAWREHTTASFSLRMLPGEHFFLHTAQPLMLEILARELDLNLSKRAGG
jgi:medium-chain acyl-[acyl-carrier-protein] hydrolase